MEMDSGGGIGIGERLIVPVNASTRRHAGARLAYMKVLQRAPFVIAVMVLASLYGTNAGAEIIQVKTFRISDGDDPSWSAPDFDDSRWREIDLWDVPEADGVIWLRAVVEIEEHTVSAGQPFGVFFAALASHEIFWDDVLLGRGGVPAANPQHEVPGPVQAQYHVPERLLQPGRHVIALRLSAHHRHFQPHVGYWILLAGDYDQLRHASESVAWLSLISLSGIVIMAIFTLVMYLIDRRDRSFLLLFFVCLTAAALLFAETFRVHFVYSYNWHLLRLIIVTALTATLNFLLVFFLVVRFPASGTRWAMLVLALGFGLAMFQPGWDGKALLMFLIGLGTGLVWALRSIRRYRSAAVLAATGIAITLVMLLVNPWRFSDLTIFFSIDILLLCLLVSHVIQVRRIRRERETALINSARLEAELLKKHIQPHFLMNTLTALAEWIEEQPRVAVSMIQSLSQEFRLLSEISSRKLIGIDEEVRLCEYHLAIMSRRKGARYRLQTSGLDSHLKIPPAIIHTLVENAVTHGTGGESEITFELRAECDSGVLRWVFESPLAVNPGSDGPGEGTGMRYIRARLAESYGDRWQLNAGGDGRVWITVIEIEQCAS